ncbi:MAG: HAD family hydrolase, partial [Deinococcales bacterium]
GHGRHGSPARSRTAGAALPSGFAVLMAAGCSAGRRFDAVAISGEVGIGKPERGIFESVATALQVELCDCVMVGDNSERDVQGGINAGMKTVWLERGFKPKTVNANFETKTLLEILPWLEQLA